MRAPAWISKTSSSSWAWRRNAAAARAAPETSLRNAAAPNRSPRSSWLPGWTTVSRLSAEPFPSEPERADARARDLRVFRRLHAAHPDGAQALPVLQDGHAALEHALQVGRAQERHPPPIDHVLVDLALAPTERGRVGLGGRDVRRDRRRAVQALEPQQVATIVHDRDADGPLVLQGFGCGGGHRLHVGQFERRFGLHAPSITAGPSERARGVILEPT